MEQRHFAITKRNKKCKHISMLAPPVFGEHLKILILADTGFWQVIDFTFNLCFFCCFCVLYNGFTGNSCCHLLYPLTVEHVSRHEIRFTILNQLIEYKRLLLGKQQQLDISNLLLADSGYSTKKS